MINIPSKRAITDSEVLAEVVDCLGEQIQIDTEGAFNQTDLFNILVRAAANSDTIENTAKTLKECPSGQAIRYHLQKFNDFKQLEIQLNQLLKSRLPRGIIKGHHSLAIDLNLIPYYGKPSEVESQYIYRSQAKAGTCSFYAYATLYIIKKGKRFTLAWTLDKEKYYLRIVYAKAVRNNSFSISAQIKAEKCLYQSVME